MDPALTILTIALAAVAGVLGGRLSAARRTEQALAARDRDHQEHLDGLIEERDALRAEFEDSRRKLVSTRATLEAQRQLMEQQRSLEAARRASEEEQRRAVEDRFTRLSTQVLRTARDELVRTNDETLDQRQAALGALLAPLNETLERLRRGAAELEGRREQAYGSLENQLARLHTSTEALRDQSRSLTTALRGDPRARGRWGELALRNVAELAGMTQHCDFSVQQATPDGNRPDMVVRLPGDGAAIPVDAKVPMDAYVQAEEAPDPPTRARHLARHARAVAQHVRDLERRDYARALGARVDFTVLFIPSDAVLDAAFEADPELFASATRKRVLLVTPVTLVALLRTVAVSWQESAVTENAREVWRLARELHHRVTTFGEHLGSLGKSLEASLRHYNGAVGSYRNRVLSKGRELEALDPTGLGERALPGLVAVDGAPRAVPAPAADAEEEDAPAGAP